MPPPEKMRRWKEKLTRSGYFLGAVILHLIVFLLVATWVVFKAPPLPPEPMHSFTPPVAEVPPPAPAPAPVVPNVHAGDSVVHVDTPSIGPPPSDFRPNIGDDVVGTVADSAMTEPTAPAREMDGPLGPRIKAIRDTVLRHRTMDEVQDHDPSGTFPVYVAAYADGDWSCNLHLDAKGNIIAGSLPDLAEKIREWSHGRIKVEVQPKPLNIGSRELLDQMPPFIFLTGHKAFKLTDQEVTNLREYLQNGGLIWGDNALAGRGSRFDVAFHEQMRRVVPDVDTGFKPVPMDADLFTKNKFVISELPEGMNYYAEPIEHLDLGGRVAIFYTPNDYSDLWAMRILPGDAKIQGPWPDPKSQSPLFTQGLFLFNRNIFFRNFTLDSSLAAQHLGMDVITYLITRFDDDLLLSTP